MWLNSKISPVSETDLSLWSNKNLNNFVRFSFKYYDLWKFCLTKMNKEWLKDLYSFLWKKEEYTWEQLIKLPRENWISIEKKDSKNYKLLKNICQEVDTFWHLRIKWRDSGRVFWWIKKDLFYILIVDINWSINH